MGDIRNLLAEDLVAPAIAEWLLVESVVDLEHRARAGASVYERIGISGIVRRTLTESTRSGGPVIHQARKRLALPAPIFEYTPYHRTPPPGTPDDVTVELSLARRGLGDPTHAGSLEEFLSAPAGVFRGEPVTVNQINRYFAHVNGGIHIGSPETDLEKLLQLFTASLPEAADLWSETLAGIAIVTARALAPIAESIQASSSELAR